MNGSAHGLGVAQPRMKAARVHEFGPPEVISFEDVDVPSPGPGEVLVEVAAAGVGPWDGWIRSGKSVLPQPLPLTLGSDLSGTVVAVGDGADRFALGERVFGVTNPRFTGAYAHYALADAAMIAPKPEGLGEIEAASVPVVAVTALQALFDEAKLVAGEHVLIHGGAGNAGRFAVQMARAAGLRVATTALSHEVAQLSGLGLDRVIDAETERFEDRVQDVDAVIDFVGGGVQDRSFGVLRRGGRLVSAVAAPAAQKAKAFGVSAHFFLVSVTTDKLERIGALLSAGALRPHIGLVLPFTQAREAHDILEGRRPNPGGKIVLHVK